MAKRMMARGRKAADTFAQLLRPVEEEAYQAYRALMDALCRQDLDYIRENMDEQVRILALHGKLLRLEDYLAELESGAIRYRSIVLQRLQLHVRSDAESEESKKIDSESAEDAFADAVPEGEENADALQAGKENAQVVTGDGEQMDEILYATITGVSRERASFYGMSGDFQRHFIARLRREHGRWIYLGE